MPPCMVGREVKENRFLSLVGVYIGISMGIHSVNLHKFKVWLSVAVFISIVSLLRN